MAIVAWPHDEVPSMLLCVICNQERKPSEVSAGLCDAKGRQAFACNGHFWFSHQFILGWSAFASQQREQATEKATGQVPTRTSDGWLLR
ncbi:MAG TPA: hypothetical protein VJR27_01350 [Candidatus Saccharimonadales bacterium]|nr:hypothetical protein [Candidatus Saccharimonadales bacterium]